MQHQNLRSSRAKSRGAGTAPMQFWVYLLRCRDGSYYAAQTDDLQKRLWQHNEGLGAEWTKRRRPVELVWCADAPTRDEAFAFERRIKNWSRAKKEALIEGDWELIGHFARPPHERPSTSLGTNEGGESPKPLPLVLSGARSAQSQGAGTESGTG